MSRINHRGWYLYGNRQLWIVPPKCGSTSFSVYCREMVRYEGSAIHPWDECFVVVRHPYERVVSALTMAGADLTTDAFMARVSSDMHLSTYQSWINGRDAMPVRLEALAKKPGFPHLHRRDHPEWFDTSIDWGRVYPFYKEDFELCPDWSYQIAA